MNTTAWPEGIKKTKQREAIWSVLTTTDKPITALEIAERLGVCTSCGAMIPLHTCPVVEMPKELSKAGFTVTEHHLEIAGICRNCKDKNK